MFYLEEVDADNKDEIRALSWDTSDFKFSNSRALLFSDCFAEIRFRYSFLLVFIMPFEDKSL